MKMITKISSAKKWLYLVAAGLIALAGQAWAAESVTYYYTSPQGTVLATTDAAGNVLSTADYRPYGAQALGVPEQGPGYTGHVNDTDSGLTYMQARYYDPVLGRFLSVDPQSNDAGNPFAFGRYSYAGLNPITNIDPDGRQTVPGSIDWQTPGMMEAWQETGREVTLPVLLDVVPLGGIANCAMDHCGIGGWAMAVVPVAGELKGAGRIAKAAERMAAVAGKGKRGEETVRRLYDIGEKVAIDVGGRKRFPDGLVALQSISEVKNTAKLARTSQLRDYIQFAKNNNLQFNLYTDEATKLSKTVQKDIANGDINHITTSMNP